MSLQPAGGIGSFVLRVMIARLGSLRSFVRVLVVAAATLCGAAPAVLAGDGHVLHLGETTTLHLEGRSWVLDRAASRQVQRVAVESAGGSATVQRFRVRGLKTGQVMLVFRSGQNTLEAHIDVLR